MQDFIAAMMSFFLVDPLQQEMADALAATRAPQQVVTAVASCATQHAPEIINRAVNDPLWATSSAFSVWVGLAEPLALLVEAAPECSAAVEAARPFLHSEETQGG